MVLTEPALPSGTDATMHLTADGKVTIRIVNGVEPLQTGTYKLEGNTLRLVIDTGSLFRDRVMTIDLLNNEALTVVGQGEIQGKRTVFNRNKAK